MSYDDELNWLRDRGVQIDHKGRIIVSLPAVPDDVDFDVVEREPSIAELMRHDINPRLFLDRAGVAAACQRRSSVIQALRELISNRRRASAGRRSARRRGFTCKQ